jgi:hypothetical protein
MLKAHHGWIDTSFNDLLRILGDKYLEGNKVPANTYQAKKLIRPVALKLKKFHACPNHCILYRGEYENLQSCLHCGTSRYKKNASYRTDDEEGPSRGTKKKKMAKRQPPPEDDEEEGYAQRKSPTLSVWYLPVIDWLRALFGNPEDAKLMSWHASAERMKGDGKLRHPSNGKQWKRFNAKFQEFGNEARNVRFALSTDGMNPFNDLNNSHNT